MYSITHNVLLICILSMIKPTYILNHKTNKQNKLHGLGPRANYTDRATHLKPQQLIVVWV
jgi:hypothetical protein